MASSTATWSWNAAAYAPASSSVGSAGVVGQQDLPQKTVEVRASITREAQRRGAGRPGVPELSTPPSPAFATPPMWA
jgi:hypothetical protein